MFDKATLLFLYAETPVHTGSGTSLGVVDLPIQRERATGYPLVQASGLKGCLRDALNGSAQSAQKVKIVFGPETNSASDHAGALSVGDARVLLFPVRSLVGIFAWVTCEHVLARFHREAQLAGISLNWQPIGPGPGGDSVVYVSKDTVLKVNDRVVLEEFAFTAETPQNFNLIAQWLSNHALPQGDEYQYWRENLPKRLAILPDNAFRDFVQLSTEVIARVRIDSEKKTVARGALWTEEHLPSETLLYATLFASKPRVQENELPEEWRSGNGVDKVLEFVRMLDGKHLQIGGDSTVGRGFVKVHFYSRSN
ncbi:MAG: type III-B CRISPR module RAMP protein Cmr4, partial [Anaerolineales bacterium]|nr:type III-B CRISPR module RAMP protein Cmr4 [Anaerolineales bacterium]